MLEDSHLAQLVTLYTQHVHTQEEVRAPVAEACNPSTGSIADLSGCFVADAFVFPSVAPSELLIVDCAVRSGSVVIGTALSDPSGNCAEEISFSEPEAGLLAPVVEGPTASLVGDPGRPEISDVGNLKPGGPASIAVPDGSPPVNISDVFGAGFEAGFESCEKPVGKLDDCVESEVGMSWDQFPRCSGRRGSPNGPPVPVLPLWLPALLPFRWSPSKPSLTDGGSPELQTESSTVLPCRSGSSSLIMNFQTDGSLHCTVKVALPGAISSPNRRRSVVDALPASGAQAGCESRMKNSFLESGY